MAYTFGAGTSHYVRMPREQAMTGNGIPSLVAGWWYPTTLTATRKLWSTSNTGIFGAEIDSTTSELRLKTDNNTTSAEFTTTGVGLTTNEWKFLAFLISNANSGPSSAWRVWSGTIDSPPSECTVTSAVSPSGNFNASSTFYIGNAGTTSLSFQGDIGWVTTLTSNSILSFELAAAGAITDAEALFALERFVRPIWLGHPFGGWNLAAPYRGRFSLATADMCQFLDLDRALGMCMSLGTGTVFNLGATVSVISGATPSANKCPRPIHTPIPQYPAPVRR